MTSPSTQKPVGPLAATGLTKTCARCRATGAVSVDKGAAVQPALLIDWAAKADPTLSTGGRDSIEVAGDIPLTLGELLDAAAVCDECAQGKPEVFKTRTLSAVDPDVHPHAREIWLLKSAMRKLKDNDTRNEWLMEEVAWRSGEVLARVLPKCTHQRQEILDMVHTGKVPAD